MINLTAFRKKAIEGSPDFDFLVDVVKDAPDAEPDRKKRGKPSCVLTIERIMISSYS